MTVRVERDGAVAILTLSKPSFNFFDKAMVAQLADALEAVDADPSLRASILTSDQRVFCAGADFHGDKPDPGGIYSEAVRVIARVKPLIAAVRDSAVGGGFGLALAADMRVGCSDTRFHANFTRIGLSPGFGITATLPRIVGAQVSLDMLLTARRVDGAEAFRLRLLDRFVEPAEVDSEALVLAVAIAANSPHEVCQTRSLLRLSADDFAAATKRELAGQGELFGTPNFDEGVLAGREKRVVAIRVVGDRGRRHDLVRKDP